MRLSSEYSTLGKISENVEKYQNFQTKENFPDVIQPINATVISKLKELKKETKCSPQNIVKYKLPVSFKHNEKTANLVRADNNVMHVCQEKDGNYVIPLDKLSLFTVKV